MCKSRMKLAIITRNVLQGMCLYKLNETYCEFAGFFLLLFFQRELSIIDFTLNFPPIRNNLTSASLLSMLIETDYINYLPIRNNITSASLLSMIIEMDYNLLGMKAGTVPRCRAEICRARNIFFLSRSTKGCNSVFFSLCHLQIVLLTIANTKIYYFLPK